MSYFKEVMQPGETVLYDKNLHWIVYLRASFFAVPLVVVGGFFGVAGNIPALAAAVIGAIALYVHAWFKSISTEVIVTDRRVILKTGIFIRTTMEMNMTKVETVDVVQTIIGRVFGYGTVIIRGTGSTYEPLRDVDAPIELRNSIIAR